MLTKLRVCDHYGVFACVCVCMQTFFCVGLLLLHAQGATKEHRGDNNNNSTLLPPPVFAPSRSINSSNVLAWASPHLNVNVDLWPPFTKRQKREGLGSIPLCHQTCLEFGF
jgi:hypothetical protein